MTKKILSLLVLLIFTTVSTNASTNNSLKDIYDDLNYALEVEWDQKDMEYYQREVKEFEHRLALLNATPDEILAFMATEVKDKNLSNEIQNLRVLSRHMPTAEFTIRVRELQKHLYSKGASWNEDAEILFGAVATIAFIGFLYFIVSSNRACASYSAGEYDEWIERCNPKSPPPRPN